MTAPRLSPTALAAISGSGISGSGPAYDRDATTAGVVHIGLGAFARAHVARYCDDLIATGDAHAAMVGISLRSGSTTTALGPQGGLYTLTETDGQSTRDRIIGAVTDLVQGGVGAADAIARPETRVVTATITEKGYHHSPGRGLDFDHPEIAGDIARPDAPRSAPGVLVTGLRQRRDAGLGGIPVISCDNLDFNGAVTSTVVTDLAGRIDPSLADWIAAEVTFPSTVVDRIVPATTAADRLSITERLGYVDAAPVRAEMNCSWVIERCDGLPAWNEVGATLTDDVTPWQLYKLRAVNGPHSALAYLGGLAGHSTIDAAVADADLASFVAAMISEEVAPGLHGDGDGVAVASATLGRFANRALGHRCSQVAADGSRKLRQRIVDVIAERRAQGAGFERLALVVAAWMAWVGAAAQGRHRLVDPDADSLVAAVRSAGSDPAARVAALMETPSVFPAGLREDREVRTAVAASLDLIDVVGTAEAARRLT